MNDKHLQRNHESQAIQKSRAFIWFVCELNQTVQVVFSLLNMQKVDAFEEKKIILWSDLVVSIYILLIYFFLFNVCVCFLMFTNRIFDWNLNFNSKKLHYTIDFINGVNIGIVCVLYAFLFLQNLRVFFSKKNLFAYCTNWFSDWIAHNRHKTYRNDVSTKAEAKIKSKGCE